MSNDIENTGSPLFEDHSLALAQQRDAAAVARATQEIQASLIIAKRFPRDEIKARTQILNACKRKGLAEVAEYEYSRGGQTITGPTIDLLRAIASRWGNLLFGWTEVERIGSESAVRCWAWDLQSNTRPERTFRLKHWRDTKDGGYLLEEERDIYELIANMAARRVRGCLEEVIDSDLVEDAVNACRETMKNGEKIPLRDRIVQMVQAFAPLGVTQEMIEAKFQKKAEAISEIQLASLRRTYKSLRDGIGSPEQYFIASAPNVQPPNITPTSGTSQPASSPAPVAAPVAAPAPGPSVPVASEQPNVIKAIRGMLAMGKFKENELLTALVEAGSIPPGMTSLEELLLKSAETVQRIHDNFGSCAAAIKEWRKTLKA